MRGVDRLAAIRTLVALSLGLFLVVLPSCSKKSTSPANRAPSVSVVAVSPAIVGPSGTATVTVTASDPDGDALTYAYVVSGGTVAGTGATVTWTLSATPGAYTVDVTVTDGRGGSGTKQGTCTVTSAPTILSTSPADGATQVAINTQIVVTFSKAMNPATVAGSLTPVVSLGTPVMSVGNTVATFTPGSALAKGTLYTLTVSGQDVSANNLAGTTTFTFTTVPDISGLYVANASENRITVYTKDIGGNATPIRNITGALTQLNFPYGLALDASGNLFVASYYAGKVFVFAPAATGNVAPIRTISGALTGIVNPTCVTIDQARNELYVSDGSNAIFVFALTANGNVAPLRKIQGAGTTLTSPRFMAIEGTKIFVSDESSSSVKIFNPTSNGNVAPDAVISGAATTLSGPAGLDIFSGELYVANYSGASVVVFPTTATGNAAPARTIAGASTGLSLPVGLATDLTGNLLIGSSGKVSTFGAGVVGNTAPIRTLTGASTLLGAVRGIIYKP